MKLTSNEFKVLKAIDDSEYGNDLSDGTWTFSITDNSDLNPRSVPGIIASLLKKGLVITGGNGTHDDEYTIALTAAGIEAYLAALKAAGLTSKKHVPVPNTCVMPGCTAHYNHAGPCNTPSGSMSAKVAAAMVDAIELQMAVEKAGDENGGEWKTEGRNVMRKFHGHYTIAEVEAVLRDMKRVQTELDRITR